MVPMAAAIVAHGRSDVFRDGIEILHELVDRLGLEFRMSFEGFVQVCDVSPMVFVMVDFHGFRVDMRFQSVEWVG
jgi:hypothetical protein